jgi:hypothetical protein
MDAGVKKKLNLNPRINASPLSLVTFGYDKHCVIPSVILFLRACW